MGGINLKKILFLFFLAYNLSYSFNFLGFSFNNNISSNENFAKNFQEKNYKEQVLNLVNLERKKSGLKPIILSNDLNKIAFFKAEDMAKNSYFSHTSPKYGSTLNLLKKNKINYSHAGENIACGQKNPIQVMESWMKSPGHRKNILNPNYTEMGIAIDSEGKFNWAQLFIKKR